MKFSALKGAAPFVLLLFVEVGAVTACNVRFFCMSCVNKSVSNVCFQGFGEFMFENNATKREDLHCILREHTERTTTFQLIQLNLLENEIYEWI